MNWYYVVGKERMGPVGEDEFRALVGDGTITATTLVWNETMTDWKPFETVQPVPEAPDADAAESDSPVTLTSGTSFCSECGRSFPDEDLITYESSKVCASCKPVFVQKIREGLAIGGIQYGGFWLRFGATIIDGMIMSVVNMIIGLVGAFLMIPMMGGMDGYEDPDSFTSVLILQGFIYLIQLTIDITYQTWFLGKYGATPGKMICGIVVVTGDQEKITYMRAFGRYFAEMLNYFTFGLTYLMVAFDDQKRGLHDRICDTLVIKKEN